MLGKSVPVMLPSVLSTAVEPVRVARFRQRWGTVAASRAAAGGGGAVSVEEVMGLLSSSSGGERRRIS
jgi:hypothetical protein